MPTALELAEKTPPGMAHYAGTGPPNTTCDGCAFFMGTKVADGGLGSALRPGRCRQFINMMKQRGRAPVYKIPAHTNSCRYYKAKKG